MKFIAFICLFAGILQIGLLTGCRTSVTVVTPELGTSPESSVQTAPTPTPETTPTFEPAKAFPGAVGLGSNSLGGRGGAVIKVTNLNDSGPGSLREALAALGPRIVVFDVSGNINLTSILTITEPYVTIAGQTSPGGIAVSGKQFNIGTHDVIVRHMRFRSGGHEYDGNDSDGDSLSIWGQFWGGNPVYNVIVDKSSITWGTDETFSVSGGATAVTIQRCLIAEGLKFAKFPTTNHSKGLMVSGKYQYDVAVSLYQNYIAHNWDRSPLLYNPELNMAKNGPNGNTFVVEGSNNVIYDWKGGLRSTGGGNARVNWIDNYAKEGINSNRIDYIFSGEAVPATPEPLFYLSGNIGTARSATDPEWRVGVSYTADPLSEGFRQLTPWPVEIPLPRQTMTASLASQIVADSGASAPVRDSVDQRIIDSYTAETGTVPDTVSYPGDWPVYSSVAPALDSDGDGMPDYWEEVQGLDQAIDDSAQDADGDGYTNIEEYLNTLADAPQTN